MSGIILMITGGLLLIIGVIFFIKGKEEKNAGIDKSIQKAEDNLRDMDSDVEPVEQRKKNGLEFEKYIVQRFDKKFFKIKSWAGDKYVNGYYAENTTHPDLVYEFGLKEKIEFAIECKWRKQIYKGGIEFASVEQLKRYNDFEKSKGIPVFIAIGLGGKGASPESVYVIPLRDLKQNYIRVNDLERYEKKTNGNFYFDTQNIIIK